jgi:hypothetical protein
LPLSEHQERDGVSSVKRKKLKELEINEAIKVTTIFKK